jgi:hypothetical protein
MKVLSKRNVLKSKNQIYMIPDKVLYTDGHDVTVTESTFQVKNRAYELRGITKFGLLIRRPDRFPGILLCLGGLILAACGYLGLIPYDVLDSSSTNANATDPNTLALWIGAGLVLLGVVMMAVVKERYSVRIATAEGEKDAIVSSRKEYISQIVDALNRAASYIQYNSRGTRYLNSIK